MGKTCTCTYFGDSGVKGSGKVVGLAVEHKGAWVIIDLGIHSRQKRKGPHSATVDLKLAH